MMLRMNFFMVFLISSTIWGCGEPMEGLQLPAVEEKDSEWIVEFAGDNLSGHNPTKLLLCLYPAVDGERGKVTWCPLEEAKNIRDKITR